LLKNISQGFVIYGRLLTFLYPLVITDAQINALDATLNYPLPVSAYLCFTAQHTHCIEALLVSLLN